LFLWRAEALYRPTNQARGHVAGGKKMTKSTFRNGKGRDSDVTMGRLPADLCIAALAVQHGSHGETDNRSFPQHAETPVMRAGNNAFISGSTGLQPPGRDAG